MIRILLFLLPVALYGQQASKRGYIAIGLGTSFLTGSNYEHKPGAGATLNLINCGYTIGKGFGVSAIWAGGAHHFDSEIRTSFGNNDPYDIYVVPLDSKILYGILMLGPMYSISLSQKMALDLKARGGRFVIRDERSAPDNRPIGFTISTERRSIGYSFGLSLRNSFAPHWCMIFSADYHTGRSDGLFSRSTTQSALGIIAGVGFQF